MISSYSEDLGIQTVGELCKSWLKLFAGWVVAIILFLVGVIISVVASSAEMALVFYVLFLLTAIGMWIAELVIIYKKNTIIGSSMSGGGATGNLKTIFILNIVIAITTFIGMFIWVAWICKIIVYVLYKTSN